MIKFIKREGIFAFVIKVLDTFLKIFGVSFLSFMNLKDYDLQENPYTKKKSTSKKIFSKIYQDHYWKSKKSLSGKGSDLESTKNYTKDLSKFLNEYRIKSIFDVPCGDFTWMNEFLKKKNIRYKGGDIVKKLINDNIKRYPDFDFSLFDLTKDQMSEDFDALHIRDCLFHFSFYDIKKTLKNIINYKVKYVLITNHQSILLKNYDIKTGKFRYLDFNKKPFFFPRPIVKLKDYKLGEFPRYIYVWKKEDFKKTLDKLIF